MHAIVTNQWVW